MHNAPPLTLIDRLIFLCFGALIGVVYGALMALATVFAVGVWHPQIVSWSVGVFAVLGFISGGFVGEAFLLLLHFVWGLLSGFAFRQIDHDEAPQAGYLGAVLFIGFGTGLVLALSWPHMGKWMG